MPQLFPVAKTKNMAFDVLLDMKSTFLRSGSVGGPQPLEKCSVVVAVHCTVNDTASME